MFHGLPCPCARLGGTLLSRFHARACPCLLCKTGFAASMPQRPFWAVGRRLSAVNVKLTIRLGIGPSLLGFARGGVGMSPGLLARNEGGLLRPSFFFWRLASCGDPDLARQRQAA